MIKREIAEIKADFGFQIAILLIIFVCVGYAFVIFIYSSTPKFSSDAYETFTIYIIYQYDELPERISTKQIIKNESSEVWCIQTEPINTIEYWQVNIVDWNITPLSQEAAKNLHC